MGASADAALAAAAAAPALLPFEAADAAEEAELAAEAAVLAAAPAPADVAAEAADDAALAAEDAAAAAAAALEVPMVKGSYTSVLGTNAAHIEYMCTCGFSHRHALISETTA